MSITNETSVGSIQERLNAIAALMVTKGLSRPEADVCIRADREPRVSVCWLKETGATDWDKEYLFADSIAEMETIIAAMPSRKDREMHVFMARLSSLIDLGREKGIEVAYVNPLVETMKRLSENILTYKKSEGAE